MGQVQNASLECAALKDTQQGSKQQRARSSTRDLLHKTERIFGWVQFERKSHWETWGVRWVDSERGGIGILCEKNHY